MAASSSANVIEDIATTIRERIASGEYQPGERLKQEVLAAEFGVSRTPVREALTKLETQGIITQEPRRSAVVSAPSTRDIGETYRIRAALEGLAAELAARWITDDQLAELRQTHDKFVAAVTELRLASKDASRNKAVLAKKKVASKRWIETNAQFHHAIGRYSHNLKLESLLSELRAGSAHGAMTASASAMDLHRMETNIQHHEDILQALEARDEERARQTMQKHVSEAGEYVAALLSHRQ